MRAARASSGAPSASSRRRYEPNWFMRTGNAGPVRRWALAAGAARAAGPLTAAQAVDRIKAKLAAEGVTWKTSYFDGFKIGDPQVPLTGIATCFQPTFSVLRRAAAAGMNFVISHESAFWDGFDPVEVVKLRSVLHFNGLPIDARSITSQIAAQEGASK